MGPEGYYGTGTTIPHFGIVSYNPKKVVLFGIIWEYYSIRIAGLKGLACLAFPLGS